ncbi:uncharacterized protein LOC131068489 isoform X1 [Cryptomeria japonica]|uniref:uncharacterized protein LOC131068489 isoform X1 n=1 Tax=Cryptomeria japonica TaxID=3369 RepID=UPI0027DA6C1E|nr:uncharacterized protein LOC131068489 isoform X1 [Cryptomeria japonica]
MPTEGAAWERREILREKRYERGEKISFARGRREGAAASAPQPPLALNPVSSNRSAWLSASARQGRSRHFFDDSTYGSISSPSDIPGKGRSRLFLDDGAYGSIPSPSSDIPCKGRSRLFLDDGAYGPIPIPSTDVPAREKIYEEDNLGFHMEGRYNKRNRELIGSGPRGGYLSSEGKTYEDENLGFRMEGRYSKRGREPVGSGLGSINASCDILDLGKSYEDEGLGFRVEGRFNRRSRELVGSSLSSRRPSFDDAAKEKFYEEESPPGFYMEGMYSKRGRELVIGSDLSSSHSQRDRKHQNWDGELITGSDLPHRDRKTQHWDSGLSSFLSTGRHDTVIGKSVDQMSLHSPHLYFDKQISWDQIQSQEPYRKTALEYASSDNKFVAQMGGSENDFGRFSRDFETKLDTHGSFSSSDSLLGDAQNPQQDHLDSFISRKCSKWAHLGKYSWSSLSGQTGIAKEPDKELKEPHDIHGSMFVHDSTSKMSTSALGVVVDDETHSRKKQRLGWGQGLAKYEKRKVEGPEDENNRRDIIQYDIPLSSKTEVLSPPLEMNLDGRSPKVNGSSGYMSPATTYSITCISSPDEHVSSSGAGTNDMTDEEKACHNVADNNCNGVHVASGSHLLQCSLPISGSESILVETSSEHVEQSTILTTDKQNTEVITSNFSGSESSLAAGKLLSVKNDILQKLENTEHEIEKYEIELRLLISEIEFNADGNDLLGACTEVVDRDLGDRCSNALDVDVQVSSTAPTSNDGPIGPSLDPNGNQVCASSVPLEMQSVKCQMPIQKENATNLKVVGVEGSEEDLMDKQSMECQLVQTIGSQADTLLVRSQIQAISEIKDCENVTGNENECPWEGQSNLIEDPISVSYIENDGGVSAHLRSTNGGADIVSSIYAANKKLTREALECNEKFLPADMGITGDILSDVLDSSMWKQLHERNREQIEAKIVDQRQFLLFKERALALKFRVLRQLWKDDQYSLSTKRHRARAQKRSEINCRANGGNQKYQLPIRSRFASPAGTSFCPPTKKAIELAGKLISDRQDRPCRSVLKMPALVLDEKEKVVRFSTSNGIVDDPIAVEKERIVINPWTHEEREIFLEKFAIFGKNFSKVASFLEHKTVADCIEFYYKNQKSESFEKVKKMHKVQKERDCHHVSTYLATAGNNRHRDSNAVSLDVFNASSVVAASTSHQANVFQNTPPMNALRTVVGLFSEKQSRDARDLESERECTAAADVLAGICGALSSEAVSSCITGGADQSEVLHENSFSRSFLKDNGYPSITEALQSNEIQYSSEEGCEEVYVDWTDDEKACFINALTMFGRDFESISRYIGSRTEEQCKTFFSKVRKRLGLDELMLRESYIPTKNNDGSDDDERGGLIDVSTSLCDIDSSAKVPAISDPEAFNSGQLNFKASTVIEGAQKIEAQDNEVEFFMEEAKSPQNEETGQNTSTGAVQIDVKMSLKEAAFSPHGEHFLSEGSLTDTRGDCQIGTLMDIQHDENILKVKEDLLCCNNNTETQSKAETNDSIERFHGTLHIENTFIVDKGKSKGLEIEGLTDSISSEKIIRSPCNIKEESFCTHVTSGFRSVDTTEFSAPVLSQNSLNNLEVMHKDECMTSLHASGNVSSNEKYLIGSVLLITGSDPFDKCEVISSPKINAGMESNTDILISKAISNESVTPSLITKETPQRVFLDQKASCSIPVPSYMSDSQLNKKFSDAFSQVSQPMVHHMQPEVVAWDQKQEVPSNVVLSKNHSMFQESASSLVRNQKLESGMVHHYPNQSGSQNQNQEELCLGAMLQSMQQSDTSVSGLSSQQFQGLKLKDCSNGNVDDGKYEILQCSADTEQSPRNFGGHQLKVLHQTESQSCSSLISNAYQQGSLKQNSCHSEVSSQVPGGQHLLVTNLEDPCLKKSTDACQQTKHKQLVQGGPNPQMKSRQQHQVIQQNLQENVLETSANANKEHLALAAHFIEKPISKQLMWDQRKQSTQYAEHYQLLHLWQQKNRGHNIICDNHMLSLKEEKQVDHQGCLQFQQTNNKFKPVTKPVYSYQSSSPTPKTDEQTANRGDVKLFGQILQSHSSNLSKLPPRNEVVNCSTASFEGRQKLSHVPENDEHCHAVANFLSEQQLPAKYVCMYSEGIAGKTKNNTSWKLKESTEMSECFAEGCSGPKTNFRKAGTVHSSQEFGGRNLQFWEDSSRHDPCKNTSQTRISHFSKDLDSQCKSMSECFSGSSSVDQTVKANKFKVLSLDSSMIPGWHGSVIQDVPYLTKDPLTVRECDYYPSGYKELGNGYIFSLGVKQPDLLVELRRGAGFDRTLSHEPGRCDTVQSILPFQGQMRNISSHTGIQAGRGVPGGSFVSDPVAAFRMQCSTVEQVKASFQHPHFRSTRDQGLGRGDYGS